MTLSGELISASWPFGGCRVFHSPLSTQQRKHSTRISSLLFFFFVKAAKDFTHEILPKWTLSSYQGGADRPGEDVWLPQNCFPFETRHASAKSGRNITWTQWQTFITRLQLQSTSPTLNIKSNHNNKQRTHNAGVACSTAPEPVIRLSRWWRPKIELQGERTRTRAQKHNSNRMPVWLSSPHLLYKVMNVQMKKRIWRGN